MSAQIIDLPRFGATPADWTHFDILLGLTTDLLPVVSNPSAEISPDSKMKGLGKTPSRYNAQGKVAGIASWTQHQASGDDIERWSRQPDLGICVQTRHARALDVDIGDLDESRRVAQVIADRVGTLPCRMRNNANKFLLAFRIPGDMPKRVIKTQHGMIEFLATGQQFVAVGTHPSGARYTWSGGLPDDLPTLTRQQFEDLWSVLANQFAVEPPIEARTSSKAQHLTEAAQADTTAQYLMANDWVKSTERDGRLHIRCPWEAEHTTASADSATSYFPAHTGGYERGHFRCLHAHCEHRTDGEFLAEIGVPSEDDFDVLPDDDDATPGETPAPQRFAVVPAHEFAAGVAPAWIVKDVLPAATLAVLFGDSGSGKTFLCLDLVGAIVRGEPWREKRVTKGRCVYIVAEGAGGFRNRLKAYADNNEIPLEDLDIGVVGDAPNFMLPADIKALLASVRAYGKVDVIVVDTFAQVMPGGNENSGEDVGKALSHCKALHKHTGALVILVHHSGKDATRGARGWSGLRAAADAEIEIQRVDNDRVATVTKLKDGEDGAEFGFKLQTVVLGQDADGEDISSCVIEHTNATPRAQRKKEPKGAVETVVWRVANDLVGLGEGDLSANDVIEAAVNQMVHDEGKRDTRRQRVMRAIDALIAGGRLFVEGTSLKITGSAT